MDHLLNYLGKAQKLAEKRNSSGKLNRDDVGSSGIAIYSGFYDEEYLVSLQGTERADCFDKMKRSDGQLTMLLTSRKNPILSANWFIEPAKSDDPAKAEFFERQAKHAEYEFFTRGRPFKDFLQNVLTFIEHGFVILERVHEIIEHPEFGKYVGYKNLAYRSQRTIEEWHLERDGTLTSVEQMADGDLESNVTIPGEFLSVFTLNKEGDNYEGLSAFRPVFGNYIRKNMYQKLMPIGIERYAIGTPIGKIPAGKEESDERDVFRDMLQNFTSHEKAYMMLPEGWDVDFTKGQFDAEKVREAISMENLEMAKSFVAPHLELGTGGNGGAYALGNDFSDSFLSIIQNDADIIARGFNETVIKEFIRFNYGTQTEYPKLKVSGINDKVGKEFAEVVKILVDAKVITPTETLEKFMRDQFKLPELSVEEALQVDDVRETEAPVLFSEKLQLADAKKVQSKISADLEKSDEALKETMRKEMSKRGEAYINSLVSLMRKEPKSKWRTAAKNIELKGQRDYKNKLERELAQIAARAVAQARSETPGGRKVQFGEGLRTRLSLQDTKDVLKSLPKDAQDAIKTQAILLQDAQDADLEKTILFQFDSSIDSTEDPDLVGKDLTGNFEKFLDSPAIRTGAANSSAKIYNNARTNFFGVDDVLEKIEAVEFVNRSPVSPICQDLVGRIFRKDDPEAKRFFPPLHHNCKSFLVPIFKLSATQKRDFEANTIGLKPSNPKLEDFITL